MTETTRIENTHTHTHAHTVATTNDIAPMLLQFQRRVIMSASK